MNSDQSQTKPVSKKKQWLFRCIAAYLPLLFIVLLEIILRVAGYGHSMQLFITDTDNEEYLVMNRFASERFFSNPENATRGNAERFKKEKTPGTFRVFVLGESTTIGYPYMHNGSFHRLLQYRLLHEYPSLNTEIINVSLTAVNSYTVKEFAKEVAVYSPDVVMIYSGHNEYYGACGVGSTSRTAGSAFMINLMIHLRELRVMQLISNGIHSLKRHDAKNDEIDVTLMERMAKEQQIPYQSPLYKKGIEQFNRNMGEACEVLSKKNIPVIIGTLVSNEKDLAPFINASGEGSANDAFKKGNEAHQHGDYSKAKKYYRLAKELDLLRFRAPDTLNSIIQELPVKYAGVYVADAEKIFQQHSPYGVIGNETLLEHVHPNLTGYALLCEAFYVALKQHQLLKASPSQTFTLDNLFAAMPVTKVDSIKGAYEIAALKMRWPFNQPKQQLQVNTFEERLASDMLTGKVTWNQTLDTLLPYYEQKNDYVNALKVAETAMLEYPNDATFYVFAGKYSQLLSKTSQAALYLHKAFQLQPSGELAKELTNMHLQSDEPELALYYLNYNISHSLSKKALMNIQQVIQQVCSLKKAFAKDASKNSGSQIAMLYRQLGYETVAKKYQ
ncbi:hypothetical protein QTN47_07510 [Danxiaibacter flavus]|uniref:SGNH hydrolase-type esterase domain-containing protein n=1 Tax=Danxiaibacter flavus TaxID=3049108 RepID=A0ABV3ZBU1_9BACT|nr:hypothetical protein QNM32_07510 [Chitinophagaceae bacterium DXS]